MFKVKRTDGKGLVKTAYGAQNINGTIMFLIHDNTWFWVVAREYEPYND